MTIFVDTSGLYAMLDARDPRHDGALDTWRRIAGRAEDLLSTNYAVVETYALVQSHLGMDAIGTLDEQFLRLVDAHSVTPNEHREAHAEFRAAARRNLSFVDCVSFAVMRRLGIRSAFAFDDDFRRRGFMLP